LDDNIEGESSDDEQYECAIDQESGEALCKEVGLLLGAMKAVPAQ